MPISLSSCSLIKKSDAYLKRRGQVKSGGQGISLITGVQLRVAPSRGSAKIEVGENSISGCIL